MEPRATPATRSSREPFAGGERVRNVVRLPATPRAALVQTPAMVLEGIAQERDDELHVSGGRGLEVRTASHRENVPPAAIRPGLDPPRALERGRERQVDRPAARHVARDEPAQSSPVHFDEARE